MNKKQPETTERTKQIIKDAFWELYKEKKIEKITVKDITMKAGFNRSTFYVYFIDVYDVLNQIEEDVMPGMEHIPPTGQVQSPSPDFMGDLITIYEKNSEYFSVLLSEKGDPAFTVRMKNLFKDMMKESMKDLLNKGDVIDELELDYALEFFTGATISVVKHWYDSGKNMPMEKLMPLMQQLMSNRFTDKVILLKDKNKVSSNRFLPPKF
ncbi:TetR/AcrR family transcriptional regulator [Alkaliphilus serpentinus]|nr:TetR/AcrR family transcriptional regulator [Alkaliphilus serpentinus]